MQQYCYISSHNIISERSAAANEEVSHEEFKDKSLQGDRVCKSSEPRMPAQVALNFHVRNQSTASLVTLAP
eukprot:3587666-Amphidinium_carterae.1